ncbi:NAD(P)-dependent oxidoreductase [Priestia koreensis]|uniref:NAD(P)-dependent oxidoreductase n=1 Tax=Priestia koreensis TaxID=284581 RepID=UPI001F58A1A2|nr:NAD(P)-dependent oxidoreductase [Priestia koreensis]UNL86908.1 NAD(P)-dependent oxidoreductase [Priestia koreensis]
MQHTLGWIGLGYMGNPMTKNLLKAEYHVNVYNRSADKAAPLVDAGAVQLDSPKEIVEKSDVIFLMLSNTKAIEAVLTEDNGVLEADLHSKIIVNMSTIAPDEAIEFAKMIEEKGGTYVDAPVSGSVGVAQTGQLVVLAGGDAEVVKTLKPYFDVLGKETIHFGPSGKASAAKLSINLLLGIVGQGVGETLLLGEKFGLEKEKILEMISQSGMNTPLFQGKKDMYRNEEFPAAFKVELMSKDLGLVKNEVDRMEGIYPLAEAVNQTYREAKENGKGELDMGAVYLELKEKNQR